MPCGASAMATTGSSASSRANSTDSAPAIDPKRARTRSEMQSPSRLSAGTTRVCAPDSVSRPGVRGVNEGRPVGHIGMAGGRRVHLLFEHAFVDRRNRPLRAAVDAAIEVGRGAERVLGHGPADGAVDALGPPGLLGRVAARRPSVPPRPRRRRRPPSAPPRSGARPGPAARHPGCGGPCAQ